MDYEMDTQDGVETSQESNMTITPANRHEILYLAYGSNMSSAQMLRRCPGATPVGLGYLHGWEWLVNERGAANIVQVPRFRRRVGGPSSSSAAAAAAAAAPAGSSNGKSRATDADNSDGADREEIPDDELPGIYGVLYLLPPADEAQLDTFEEAYEKVVMQVEMVSPDEDEDENMDDDSSSSDDDEAEVVNALVYVDYAGIREDRPDDEYVQLMNYAVDDAVEAFGLPGWYVDSVIRRFIPRS